MIGYQIVKCLASSVSLRAAKRAMGRSMFYGGEIDHDKSTPIFDFRRCSLRCRLRRSEFDSSVVRPKVLITPARSRSALSRLVNGPTRPATLMNHQWPSS